MDILIIKIGAAGDVLRTTSILQGLKQAHQCHISWLTKADAVPLLENNELIDDILTLENAVPKEYDLVLSLDEDEAGCRFASTIRPMAKKFRGFYWENGVVPTPEAKSYWLMSALGPKPQNDILKRRNSKSYQRFMIEIAGLQPSNFETIFRLTDAEKAMADEFREKNDLTGFVIGLNTGAGARWPLKRLSVDKTVKLAEELSTLGTIVLYGGPEEAERNAEIIKRSKVKIVDAGTHNPVRRFAALLSVVDILITSDSLALHLAIALKRHVVAFFGPTSAAEIEMYGLGEKVISESQCYCCYKKTADFHPNCADAITTQMILDAFNRVRERIQTIA